VGGYRVISRHEALEPNSARKFLGVSRRPQERRWPVIPATGTENAGRHLATPRGQYQYHSRPRLSRATRIGSGRHRFFESGTCSVGNGFSRRLARRQRAAVGEGCESEPETRLHSNPRTVDNFSAGRLRLLCPPSQRFRAHGGTGFDELWSDGSGWDPKYRNYIERRGKRRTPTPRS